MKNFVSVPEFIARSAQQCGFERERFIEADIPSNFSQLSILLFLGDLRAQHALSSLILHSYKKNVIPKQYFILASWPGCAQYFPYVNEYWSITDESSVKDLADRAIGFENYDPKFDVYARNLRKYFDNVMISEDLQPYYHYGITSRWLEEWKDVEIYWPLVPSVRPELGQKLSIMKNKVFLSPQRTGKFYRVKESAVRFSHNFWVNLVEQLLQKGYSPVIWQNYATYDISPTFGEKCVYITDRNILNVMAAMRASDCVLDIFSGLNRLAVAARTPYIVCDERNRYMFTKDYEITDLCSQKTPHRYIFSFPTVIEHGRTQEILDNILNTLENFLKKVQNVECPSPQEFYETVSYETVREHKKKRLGARFVKVEKLVIG